MCFISLLSGCGNDSAEIDNSDFIKYNIDSVMPKIEYKVCNAQEFVTMYFPVVTNKEITGTELGGVAVKLPSMKGSVKVTLHSLLQDKINYPYQNKYVSFLKYQVNMEDEGLLQANDTVTLCDTSLWIYHNSDFQKIQVDKDYLRITFVDNEEEMVLPDWDKIIANMCENMQLIL